MELSAADTMVDPLMVADHSAAVLPKRGEKASDDTPNEWKASELAKRREHWLLTQLKPQRTIASKHAARAVWNPVYQKAQVTEQRGKFFEVMGTFINGNLFLNADEALWLVDRGRLEMTLNGIPTSVHQMFNLFHQLGFKLEYYLAYSYLKRLGYSVLPSKQQSKKSEAIPPTEQAVAAEQGAAPFDDLPEDIKQRLHLFDKKSRPKPEISTESATIVYDVWTPAERKGFSRKNPPRPSFRLAVCPEQQPVPSIAQILHVNSLSSPVPLKFAIVGPGGLLDFYSFEEEIERVKIGAAK